MSDMKTEYIKYMMWFQSDPSHLNYDPVSAVEAYLKFINYDTQAESNCKCAIFDVSVSLLDRASFIIPDKNTTWHKDYNSFRNYSS